MKKRAFFFILILTCFLIFFKIGDRYLWFDEAQNGILAKTILKYGYPSGWDGKNVITTFWGKDFNSDYVWTFEPWLPFYITALSYIIFGISEFSSRFPFALFGILSVLFIYLVSRELLENQAISILSSLYLSTSVPFLLYARQCRYYSLAIFLTLVSVYAYLKLLVNFQKRYTILFILFSTFLFYTNYILFFSFLCGLSFHLIFLKKQLRYKFKFLKNYLFIFLLILPWIFFAKPYINISMIDERNRKYFYIFIDYIFKINAYIFPLIFLPLGCLLFTYLRNRKEFIQGLFFLFIVIISDLVVTPFFALGGSRLRYICNFFPFYFILVAILTNLIFRFHRISGIIFILSCIFTNFFSIAPLNIIGYLDKRIDLERLIKFKGAALYLRQEAQRKPQSYFFSYLYELTHHFKDPNEGIVKFLKQNAKKGEIVFTNYAHTPIIFYTDLKVVNIVDRFFHIDKNRYLIGNITELEKIEPDWVILRKYWRREFLVKNLYSNIKDYKKITLDYPDSKWGNIPEMNLHYFQTPAYEDPVTIFRK